MPSARRRSKHGAACAGPLQDVQDPARLVSYPVLWLPMYCTPTVANMTGFVVHCFRVGYIDTIRGPSICAADIKGFLKVVPEHGVGDKGSQYCVDGFAIDRYGELLTERQQLYPGLCTHTIFVKTPQLVRLIPPLEAVALT